MYLPRVDHSVCTHQATGSARRACRAIRVAALKAARTAAAQEEPGAEDLILRFALVTGWDERYAHDFVMEADEYGNVPSWMRA